MKLSKEEITKIANLANLKLNETEISSFQGELSDILEFVGQLQEAETKIASTLDENDLVNVLREDEVRGCSEDTRKKTLEQSPHYNEGSIKVKRILN